MFVEITHPLVKDKITRLRDKNTDHQKFRELTNEITMLIAYEALKNVQLKDVQVETPLAVTTGKEVINDIVLVPVLRAGIGMLDGILKLAPSARVGFVGLYRDPGTKLPVEYYTKLPQETKEPIVFIIDPMLATGGSLSATIDILKEDGFATINVLSVIAAPEGIAFLEKEHPDVTIYTGNVDERLDDHKYIVPGLGDAGDRLFGTK